ncbi:MAG: cyclic nucleotide-binding domain-containing protein [Geodermatophilaceae bacterium]|nr:cyclic nucleotide-binding domain-containing protein [Geodermatophilaceae bacterium]
MRTFELLQRVPTFAAMPPLAVERLARLVKVVHVPAGGTPVRQGDIGDLFYVLEHGAMSVSQDGRELRTLGPGDSFGEIALLLAVPRTASITAVGPCRLLAVDSDSFVAAITGHRGAQQAADNTVRRFMHGDSASESGTDEGPYQDQT